MTNGPRRLSVSPSRAGGQVETDVIDLQSNHIMFLMKKKRKQDGNGSIVHDKPAEQSGRESREKSHSRTLTSDKGRVVIVTGVS